MHIQQFGEHAMVRCVDPAAMDWSAPFFRDGVPPTTQPQSQSMEALASWQSDQVPCDPDYSDVAIIFHVSRCGSTLLTRNLAARSNVLALSEPPFFSALHGRLAAVPTETEAMAISLSILEEWRRWAGEQGKRLVIKLSSQLNPFIGPIMDAMPGARCVALHRDPLPVLESLDRKKTSRLKQEASGTGPALIPEYRNMAGDLYLRTAASRYIMSLMAMHSCANNALCVAYDDLEARFGQILAHFRLDAADARLWSKSINAKAKGDDAGSPYRPVSQEQLATFAAQHPELLKVAELHYGQFCKSLPVFPKKAQSFGETV